MTSVCASAYFLLCLLIKVLFVIFASLLQFETPEIVELLQESRRKVKQRYPFTIDDMVILPDHLHCLWTLPQGDTYFSPRWCLITSPIPAFGSSKNRDVGRVEFMKPDLPKSPNAN